MTSATRTILVTLIVLVGVVAVALPSGARGNSAVTASVAYRWKQCGSASATAMRPVTAGTLVLRRAGKRLEVVLPANGAVRVDLPGEGPVSATLVLATRRVAVSRGGSAFVQIPLGSRVPANGKVAFAVGGSDQANGDVNAMIVLERAARFAAATVTRPMPRVTADVGAGEGPGFDAPRTIHVPDAALWEPTPLVHEYGHLILHTIGAEGPDGGDHDVGKSYPAKPTLAWNEGFSTAFASLVLPERGGRLDLNCKPYANPAETPARPTLATDEDKRYAQYSETRVSGAVHGLVRRLGGGPAGFKKLMAGVEGYRRGGHGVFTARDLRDLAAQRFERSAADHAAIDQIFFRQGISWEQHLAVGVDETDAEHAKLFQAGDSLVIRVTGPGGFTCRTDKEIDGTTDGGTVDGWRLVIGEKRAEGGLPFAGSDDCYLVSGVETIDFDSPRILGDEAVTIPFPYLAGQAHWSGEYSVYAKYVCEIDRRGDISQAYCPVTLKVLVGSQNPLLLVTTPAAGTRVPFVLARGVETKVASFRADGRCLAVTFDCSV